MKMMDFKSMLEQRQQEFDMALSTHFNEPTLYQHKVFEAMRYSLNVGGKRIRPILFLEAYSLCGKSSQIAKDFACALEMIHTYSLIHDDLPAMDNDDFRRGNPTNHKVFGEGMAILAGDGLLNYAYELMLKRTLDSDNPRPALLAMNTIATASGVYGMIGGQVVDMQSEGKAPNEEDLSFIHQHKTAALLKASVVAGGYLAQASQENLSRLDAYGHHIGMAFQIVDDILDIVGNQDKLGKTVGSDLERGKLTYPCVYGLEKSRVMAKEHLESAKQAICGFGPSSEFFSALADFLLHREY